MVKRLFLGLVLATVAGCNGAAESTGGSAMANTGLRYLGGEAAAGFATAQAPRSFVFPLDHGSHPEYRTEWWYFTGNVATAELRHFGFELTFFRYAIVPPRAALGDASAWRSNEVWMAHFAVTDTAAREFHTAERLARGALGLAAARTSPLRVWVKDWSASGTSESPLFVVRLEAEDDAMGLTLDLKTTAVPIPHGDNGLDRKGQGEGNSSYYYSVPRLTASGTVRVGDVEFAVTGQAWMDREWSTSSLDAEVVGWDWFALHLSDGNNLMFYRLRTASGEASSFSSGSWMSSDGGRTALDAADVNLTPLSYWTSEATAVRYPVEWELAVPRLGLSLRLSPYLANQELDLSVRYWEGAIKGKGASPAGPLTAQGYLELAGY